MNRTSIQTTIFVPVIATFVLIVMSLMSAHGQSERSGVVTHKRQIQHNFKNSTNEFFVEGVGKVIIKGSSNNTIRCEVSIIGYGSTPEEAKLNAENVIIEPAVSGRSPKLLVKMNRGSYKERRCKVITTVYIPPTVMLQHNENVTLEELIDRFISKFRR